MLLRNIITSKNIVNQQELITKISPFRNIMNTTSIFELAAETKSYDMMSLCIMQWLYKPNWNLHNAVYKLQDKKDMYSIHYINSYLSNMKNNYKLNNIIINHLMMILMLAII